MGSIFQNLFSGVKPENGVLTINLNLTIKIDADGALSVIPTAEPVNLPKIENKKTDKTEYEMPDFRFGDSVMIPFGK